LDGYSPVRIVLDSMARTSPGSKLAVTANKTPVWLVCTPDAPPKAREALQAKGVQVIEVASNAQGRVDIPAAARVLGERRLTRVLIEGGGEIAAAFLNARLVDRLTSYQAGLLMGSDSRSAVALLELQKLDFAPRYTLYSSRPLGGDVEETWHRAA
jgi:diaminohydroxyphosphoribosylaminopyrimidine deaminase/5-amino-6-(5-phosphoribosylamino)uracil reductase